MPVHPKLAGRTCYHKYEIESGLFTPGEYLELEPARCLDELGVARDLAGLRALDIGAYDGPITFELERRGAKVTALDIQDPDVTVFNAVKEIKNSSATYVRGSVYDALPGDLGTYDIVVFAGVYYHLKNPVLAVQRIRKLLSDRGLLFIEGGSTTDYLAEQLNKALGLPQSKTRTTAAIVDQLPLAYFDIEQRIYGNFSNWWFPTTRGLEVILLDSGFRNVELVLKPNAFVNYSRRRVMGRAEADPAKSDPGVQELEHLVHSEDPAYNELSNRPYSELRSRLPPALLHTAKWVRRTIRQRFY